MPETTTELAGPTPPAPHVVPEPDSELEQACAEYAVLKKRAALAKDEFEELKKKIKMLSLTDQPDGTTEVTVSSKFLVNPLSIKLVERWTFKSARLKEDNPELYFRYAEPSLSWPITEIKA